LKLQGKEYLKQAQDRRELAKVLRSEGKTLREIADSTGLTRDRVKSLLKD
jgi:DNA-binding CsgD family transcriptional regulator